MLASLSCSDCRATISRKRKWEGGMVIVTSGGKGRLGRGCRGRGKGEGINEDMRMEKGVR